LGKKTEKGALRDNQKLGRTGRLNRGRKKLAKLLYVGTAESGIEEGRAEGKGTCADHLKNWSCNPGQGKSFIGILGHGGGK